MAPLVEMEEVFYGRGRGRGGFNNGGRGQRGFNHGNRGNYRGRGDFRGRGRGGPHPTETQPNQVDAENYEQTSLNYHLRWAGKPITPSPTLSEPLTAAVQVPTIKPFDEIDECGALAHKECIFNKAMGPSPKISCKVNGVEVKALADTGSEVVTITKSLYLKNFQSQIGDTTYWLYIGTANYEGVAYLGYTELDVEIDGQVIHKAGILIQEDPTDPVKIQQKLELPMTLGGNIINRLVHEKLQEPLRAYLQLTHHTPMATCNNIKVNLDPKHPGKKYGFESQIGRHPS